MKRVLILSNHFVTIYRFRRELVEQLICEGCEVWLSLPPSDENKVFEAMGCQIVPTYVQRHGVDPVSDGSLCLRYIRMFCRLRPDVVLSYTIKPNIYGCMAARMTGTRIVCNITGTGTAFVRENWLSRIVWGLYRVSVRYAHLVFFQNREDQTYFRRCGLVRDNDELLVCGSGVNLTAFQLSPMPDDAITHFLFVGRVMRLKGIDAYLHCARQLKARGEKAVCHVAGFVDEKGYAGQLAELHKAGVIDYLGYCEDIAEQLKRCHCVVLPSLGGEGVPNVLLEASASGRACIATQVAGSNVAICDGETGYLCAPKDEQALLECMLRFIRLPLSQKQAMGERGRRYVEERFDRMRVVERYMEEIHEAAERKKEADECRADASL